MLFQIKKYCTETILFEGNFKSLRACVEAAVKARASLSWANFSGADLSGADLSWASLSWADFSGANLSGANISWASLSWANFSWANLSGADVSGANLSWANLSWANLSGAKWREGVTLKQSPVKECTRSDGYLFRLLDCDVGWRVSAGCRFFTLDEAWKHWGHGQRADTRLGEESEDILILFEHHIQRLENNK